MDTPKATHSGKWVIDENQGISVQCYVMDNEERLLIARSHKQNLKEKHMEFVRRMV